MLNFGDIVRVKAFPNIVLERRVVGSHKDEIIYLCNEEEFQAAVMAHRSPTSIGFPINDVLECENDGEYQEK